MFYSFDEFCLSESQIEENIEIVEKYSKDFKAIKDWLRGIMETLKEAKKVDCDFDAADGCIYEEGWGAIDSSDWDSVDEFKKFHLNKSIFAIKTFKFINEYTFVTVFITKQKCVNKEDMYEMNLAEATSYPLFVPFENDFIKSWVVNVKVLFDPKTDKLFSTAGFGDQYKYLLHELTHIVDLNRDYIRKHSYFSQNDSTFTCIRKLYDIKDKKALFEKILDKNVSARSKEEDEKIKSRVRKAFDEYCKTSNEMRNFLDKLILPNLNYLAYRYFNATERNAYIAQTVLDGYGGIKNSSLNSLEIIEKILKCCSKCEPIYKITRENVAYLVDKMTKKENAKNKSDDKKFKWFFAKLKKYIETEKRKSTKNWAIYNGKSDHRHIDKDLIPPVFKEMKSIKDRLEDYKNSKKEKSSEK